MAQKYIFADEAGCFTFENKAHVSKYFILCTVLMDECSVGNTLLELRRQLARQNAPLGEYFHASEDQQRIRDAVFEAITPHNFCIHATIMEKAKALLHIRATKPTFYKYGWFFHFRHGVAKLIKPDCDTLVSAAALGTRKEKASFTSAIEEVMQRTIPGKWSIDFCPSATEPCLQVADYCAWALQRKWERNDLRSYNLIKDRIVYEYDLWQKGEKRHY